MSISEKMDNLTTELQEHAIELYIHLLLRCGRSSDCHYYNMRLNTKQLGISSVTDMAIWNAHTNLHVQLALAMENVNSNTINVWRKLRIYDKLLNQLESTHVKSNSPVQIFDPQSIPE